MRDPDIPALWRDRCHGARFFEQSALEDVEDTVEKVYGPAAVYRFPRTQNYGWWRLWQGRQPAEVLQREWTMNRHKAAGGVGILINGEPLGSVHTHFYEQRDLATRAFNKWVLEWLARLAPGWAPARRLLAFLDSNAPIGMKLSGGGSGGGVAR